MNIISEVLRMFRAFNAAMNGMQLGGEGACQPDWSGKTPG
jgi:hypothetical protein